MRSTGTGDGLATRPQQSTAAPRQAISRRLAGSAVATLALAVSLLATASPAGAATLARSGHFGTAAQGAGRPAAAGQVSQAAAINPFDPSPTAWNGKDLVTTQNSPGGNLVAYEKVPGTGSWKKETVSTAAHNGGVAFGPVSITATGSAVQIVAPDVDGKIWFFQQADGKTKWSAPQLVGTVTPGSPGGFQEPAIAWTGVPGHTGTNSVITVADASGNVLFFYQNGGGWTKETVASASVHNVYYQPVLTATDHGIVIVAPATDGFLFSWSQPYGGSGWTADGNVAPGSHLAFNRPSVTWDGVNVDVVDSVVAGGLVFLWKSDSATSWSQFVMVPDGESPGVLSSPPAIHFTSGNLIISAVETGPSRVETLSFWWQGSSLTNFNFETVDSAAGTFEQPTITSTTGSSAEVAIVVPFTTGTPGWALDDWTQPVGGTGWLKGHIAGGSS
jgi:hypothetical protein